MIMGWAFGSSPAGLRQSRIAGSSSGEIRHGVWVDEIAFKGAYIHFRHFVGVADGLQEFWEMALGGATVRLFDDAKYTPKKWNQFSLVLDLNSCI